LSKRLLFLAVAVSFLVGSALVLVLSLSTPPLGPKREVAHILTMPDLALGTEALCIRHRSHSVLSDAFGLGPSLLSFFPSDFIYSPAPYTHALQEIR